MSGIAIALNVIFAIIVVGGIVGLQARAIWASRGENMTPPRRRQPRTRPATARAAGTGRLAAING